MTGAESQLSSREILTFRKSVLVCILASCSSIKKSAEVAEQNQTLLHFVEKFPELNYQAVFMLIHGPCYHGLIYQVVKDFPIQIITELISGLYSSFKKPTLACMYLMTDLVKAMFYNVHHSHVNENVITESFSLVEEYISNFQRQSHKEKTKAEALIFLHILELLKSILFMPSEESWLHISSHSHNPTDYEELKSSLAVRIITMCNNIVVSLSVDKWASWSDVLFTTAFSTIKDSNQVEVQTVIGNIAHAILMIYSNKSLDEKNMHHISTTIEKSTPLQSFLKNVSEDPDHDRDTDSSFEELVQKFLTSLEKSDQEETDCKPSKYLSLIIDLKDSSEIFSSQTLPEKIVLNSIASDKICDLCYKFAHYKEEVSVEWRKVGFPGRLDYYFLFTS